MFVLHADSFKKAQFSPHPQCLHLYTADGEGNIFVEKKNIHLHSHYITQNEDIWE